MTREEQDEKEFEKIFEENRGYWNNIPDRHDLAKHFFMESRRLMKEKNDEIYHGGGHEGGKDG